MGTTRLGWKLRGKQINRGKAKRSVKPDMLLRQKRFIRNEVGTYCKLTGINDNVECVSLQETFELHVKA